MIPTWSQHNPKMVPKWIPEASWTPLGYGSFWGSLIVASSWPLGALLEAFGPFQTNLGAALDRPKGTLETGFSDLGGQMASQTSAQKASRSLLEASWSALGALRSLENIVGIGSWAAKRRIKTRFQPTRGVRPGQHLERKAHRIASERSGRLFVSCHDTNPISL